MTRRGPPRGAGARPPEAGQGRPGATSTPAGGAGRRGRGGGPSAAHAGRVRGPGASWSSTWGSCCRRPRRRRQPVDHLLFAGPPGLGKTSLAGIVAAEMGVGLRVTSGPVLVRAGDLAALLTDLQEGDVLFIDEIHRLAPFGGGDPLPGHGGRQARHRDRQGPDRPVDPPRPAPLHPGRGHHPHRPGGRARCATGSASSAGSTSTTRSSCRPSSSGRPASSGCGSTPRGRPASPSGPGGRPGSPTGCSGGCATSSRCAGTGWSPDRPPRRGWTCSAWTSSGLDKVDRAILDALCRRFGGQPVGLTTLAQCVGEEPDTIEDAYEPFLLQQGLIQRTPRGRVATARAWAHLGVAPPGPGDDPAHCSEGTGFPRPRPRRRPAG